MWSESEKAEGTRLWLAVLEGEMRKKFEYIIKVSQIIAVYANNLDEAIDRATEETLDQREFDVIGVTPTGIPNDGLDLSPIHSQN